MRLFFARYCGFSLMKAFVTSQRVAIVSAYSKMLQKPESAPPRRGAQVCAHLTVKPCFFLFSFIYRNGS